MLLFGEVFQVLSCCWFVGCQPAVPHGDFRLDNLVYDEQLQVRLSKFRWTVLYVASWVNCMLLLCEVLHCVKLLLFVGSAPAVVHGDSRLDNLVYDEQLQVGLVCGPKGCCVDVHAIVCSSCCASPLSGPARLANLRMKVLNGVHCRRLCCCCSRVPCSIGS
jgi:hypothetical protein